MTRVIRLITMTLAMVLLAGCEKYELDRRMEELCKKDGGIRVYETVKLQASMFDQNGDPFPGWRGRPDDERLGQDYRLVRTITILKAGERMQGEGQLSRYEYRVVRLADQRTLGEAVSYGRSGGDFLAVGHFTSTGCPEKLGVPSSLIQAIFIKEGS